MRNSKELITTYLSKLGQFPLLTKEGEIEIAKKLDAMEIEIIKRSITSPIFLQAVLNVQKRLIGDNQEHLFKLLKNIDEGSPTRVINKAFLDCEILFTEIKAYLDKPTKKGKELILSLILKLAFTNFAITSFIKPLEDTYKTIKLYEKRTTLNFQTLNVKTLTEYNQLVYAHYSNAVPQNAQLASCIHNQEEIMNYYEQNQLTEGDLKKLQKLGADIVQIRRQVTEDRNKLINANLRLVVSRVRLFMNKGLDFEDLIQEGNIGLMKAIDKFDWQRGFKFSTYATWWIDQTIQRGISNKSRIIRVPIYLQDLLPKVEKVIMEIEALTGKTPTVEEISKHSELSETQVTSITSLINQPVSLETQISQDLQLKDVIVDSKEESDPFVEVSKTLLKDKIREVLDLLPEKYQKILRLRFGIGETQPLKLEKLGQQIGLTRERIRQIQNESLDAFVKKAKKCGVSGLEDYIPKKKPKKRKKKVV
jgi:RNA polymerase primary sigma factor